MTAIAYVREARGYKLRGDIGESHRYLEHAASYRNMAKGYRLMAKTTPR